MANRLLTTGQAAKSCSVTPDTVLKWIRSGFLSAQRTAGGHHRIDERELERLLIPSKAQPTDQRIRPHRADNRPQIDTTRTDQRAFRYCWEFNGKGELLEACVTCPVYRMRAQRCYEVVRLAPDSNHPRSFCKEGSCMDCDYYEQVHGQSINVLVVSDDNELAGTLLNEAKNHTFNLEITNCEYSCSALVNEFRPDFAVVDCSMGPARSREITYHLSEDPRIPFVRVVLAGNEGEFPTHCDKQVFARIRRPFSVCDIAACISGARQEALEA